MLLAVPDCEGLKAMPIYEFYCEDCNTIFTFFSRTVNTSKKPKCPRCKTRTLQRRMSAFAVTGRAKEDNDADELPVDECNMDQALHMRAGEAAEITEELPRQAAHQMTEGTEMSR